MKVILKKDDTYLIKFNKKELQTFEFIIKNDIQFNANFDILDTSIPSEYIIKQKSAFTFADCFDYLNYVFANELIDQLLRTEKINKIKDATRTRG